MKGRLFDCSSLNLPRSVYGIKYIDLSLPIRRAKKMQKLNIKCLLPHVVSATKFSQMSEIDQYQDKELLNLRKSETFTIPINEEKNARNNSENSSICNNIREI